MSNSVDIERLSVRCVTGKTTIDADTYRHPNQPKAKVLMARRGGGTDVAPYAGGDTWGCTSLELIEPQSVGT